jgi:bifunctional DNA-binding transcriptional regulator/antitoxin component of YhaV-PrlF toxin-antitoxin module
VAYTASISSKVQVVIPAPLRKKYKLNPRSKVIFREQDGKLTMESDAYERVRALRGCLSHVQEDVEAWWAAEKRKDREREVARELL